MLGTSIFRTAVASMLGLLAITILAACGGENVGPQDRLFDIEIEHGVIELESGVITVTQGDSVTMNFSADEDGLVHLHGYDIEQTVGPEEATAIEFVAEATGRYIFTFHEGGGHEEGSDDEHDGDMAMDEHAHLFESSTLEMGDTFAFEVPHDMHDSSIPFHNHMSHDVIGHIEVDEHATASGEVGIRVNGDGSFTPVEVEVQPGTKVIWTYQGEDRARIASGNPPMAPDEHEEATEEGRGDEDGEEVTLGVLEVRPR